MTVNILEDDAYIGIIQSINDYESMKPADILDDLEECHDNVGLELKDTGKVQPDDDPAVDMSTLLDSIKEVSKGVSEKTGQEYGRFLHKRNMIPEGIDFFCKKPHPQSAVYLAAWIMDSSVV
ncbi:MAG: hypothetical protein NXY57DRAFT_1044015 [Lentinula lateritia]|nr:MAG: hypothetical protein NXY57DRAFT_1044015 [Lentinula lateritia]